jgi:uncharacterized protein YaaR (DUF327 family)
MDKIQNIGQFSNLDPKIKKNKSKKSNKAFKSKKLDDESSTFDEILEAQEIEYNNSEIIQNEEKIESLLKQIGNYGEKLKKSKLLKDLNTYKNLIKEYISLILIMSEKIEKKEMWNTIKKEKNAKLHIKIINQELLDLTRLFMSEQKNTLAIAAKIDKIEGILIDLKS